jgi:hypothetical protein
LVPAGYKLKVLEFGWHVFDDIEIYLIFCCFLDEVHFVFIAEEDEEVVEVVEVQTSDQSFLVREGVLREDESETALDLRFEVFQLVHQLVTGQHRHSFRVLAKGTHHNISKPLKDYRVDSVKIVIFVVPHLTDAIFVDRHKSIHLRIIETV